MTAGCGLPRTNPRAPSFRLCCSPTVRRLLVLHEESNPTTSWLVHATRPSINWLYLKIWFAHNDDLQAPLSFRLALLGVVLFFEAFFGTFPSAPASERSMAI